MKGKPPYLRRKVKRNDEWMTKNKRNLKKQRKQTVI